MEADAAAFKPEIQPSTRSRSTSESRSYRYTDEELNEITDLEFKEIPVQTKDDFEYDRTGSDPGLLILININKYDNDRHKQRRGSNKDVKDLINAFGKINFNINKKFIHENLSKSKILSFLKEVADMDLSKYNCLVFIFMSHGNTENIVEVTDEPMGVSEFWTSFVSCKTLQGKPKLFIFQACKGNTETSTVETNELVPKCTFQEYLAKDMLVLYASVEGTVSMRHTSEGSWLIQELCENIKMYAQTEDVASIIARTAQGVSMRHHQSGTVYHKQMPVCVSTLRKQFYFTRSEVRERILRLETLNSEQSRRFSFKNKCLGHK